MSKPKNLTLQQNLAIRLLRVLRYNKARIERAIELLPVARKPLFQVVPFLLHVNHPDLPGYIDDPDAPFGLNNYSLREQVTEALRVIFPESTNLFDDMRKIWPRQRHIDALVLMGSIGTIGQSRDSDFDYWVCVDGSHFTSKTLKLLEKKLHLIEEWAEQQNIEVHFFLSEIDKVRNNDFGVAEGESSGSAQAIFLKAEFYTTNIVVAGKAPFWWLMPEKTTDAQYYELIDALNESESPDPKWFMDLGNLQQMDPNELFGAAIWQISKAMDSPFKSVLKMAKLEVFLENIDHKQPLCNSLKKRVHNGTQAPGEVDYIDPYALMFDELIEHYTKTDNQDVIKLLQLCLYIKCNCALSLSFNSGGENFKRQIMTSYVYEWGWTEQKIKKIDQIKYWNFQELSFLSKQIHSFLINCYRRMSEKLKDNKQTVSQEDMTVLGRKIDAYYSKKDNKIDYLRSAFDDELYSATVTVKTERTVDLDRRWMMYAGDQTKGPNKALDKALLRASKDPIDLLIWGISNRIIDAKSDLLLGYQTEPLVEDDLKVLARYLQKLFPPVRVSELPREALLKPARILNCLAIVNFESRRGNADFEQVKLVYSTSWGEIYAISGVEAVEALWFDLFEVAEKPGTFVFVPEGTHRKRIYQDFLERTDMKFTILN